MVDNEFVKTKLRELDDIKSALQGKIEISFRNIIALCVALIGIAYFIYVDIQEGDNELPVFMIIVGVAFIYIETKMKVANKKVDMIIKLLDLEKLADNRYAEQIKEITNTPQIS